MDSVNTLTPPEDGHAEAEIERAGVMNPAEDLLDEDFLDGLPDALPEDGARRKHKKRVRRLILLGVLLAALAVAAYFAVTVWFAPEAADVDDGPREYVVATGDVGITYELDGRVGIPFSYLDADYSAEVLSVNVEKGDAFKEGDVLALLDDTSLQEAVDAKQDALDTARSNLKEAQTSLQEARTAVSTAQNNLKKQEISYQNTLVEAENSDFTKQMNIDNQKQAIAELEAKIKQAENELVYMEEFPDEYTALEISTKRNDITTQKLKLQSEKNTLAQLEKQAGLEDTTQLSAQLQLRDAQDAVTKAQTNVTRAEDNLAQAQRAVEKAEQALADARDDLKNAQITAPCDGTVIAVNLSAGDTAGPAPSPSSSTSFIVYLEDGASYTAVASVPELDLGSVFVGQEAEIEIEAWDGGTVTGTVTNISDFASSGSNNVVSYEITVKFSGAGKEGIREQMNCTITYITKQVKNVLTVTQDVLYTEYGKTYVDVKTADGEVEKREVTTGFSNGSSCEIINGLTAGETVLSQTLTKSSSSSGSNANSRGDIDGMADFFQGAMPNIQFSQGGDSVRIFAP